MSTPTKQQEIAILEQTIGDLGPDSYRSVQDCVNQCIKSDIFPQIHPSETTAAIERQIESAQAEAERILADARKQAERITTEASNRAILTRSRIIQDLRSALRELDP